MHSKNGAGSSRGRYGVIGRSLVATAMVGTVMACREPPVSGNRAAAGGFTQEGIFVDMDLDAGREGAIKAGKPVKIRFTIREAWDTGEPLTGLFPMAWLVRRGDGEPAPDPAACKKLLRDLLAGRLARSADVDLNKYYLVTLDDNNSITLIDPQIDSSKTKTLGMISLSGKGVDFVLAPDRDTVFVSLAAGGRIAAASMTTMRARYIDVGGGPRRLALQPDGRIVWVGDRERSAVVAVDAHEAKVLAEVAVGPGPHELAFRADSDRVFVASPQAAEISVIDSVTLSRKARVEVGAPVIGLAASAHSRKVYAALARGGVAVLDDDSGAQAGVIPLDAPLSHLAMSPDGRWAFALAGDLDRLFVIDTAVARVVHEIPTRRAPAGVDFSDTFAYVRHHGSEQVVLVDLGTLDRKPQVSEVVMGQRPLVSETGEHVAPAMVRLPEGGGALVLNERDRSVYHFMEGMSAPMGSYALYPWPVKGILLVDRSLKEVSPGVYESELRAPRPGTYTVAFLQPGSPRIHSCDLAVEVAGTKQVKQAPLRMEALFAGQVFAPGAEATLDIRLLDTDSGAPVSELDDVVILAFRGPRWQWRGRAKPLGNGRYQVRARFPEAGAYTVMVEARSRGVRFGELPWSQVIVGEKHGRAPAR